MPLSAKSRLVDIPAEILLLIMRDVETRADVNSLCQTCKNFYEVLNPWVWENITIRAEERMIHQLNVNKVLRSYEYPSSKDYLSHVKDLQVTAPFVHSLDHELGLGREARCPHDRFMDLIQLPENQSESALWKKFEIVHGTMDGYFFQLKPLFDRLKKDQLRSFNWDMGTCLPHNGAAALFGEYGYLSNNQTAIESLSLTTEGDCPSGTLLSTGCQLGAFKNLRHFSWRGWRLWANMLDVHEALKSNAKRLESIELDCVDWKMGPLEERQYFLDTTYPEIDRCWRFLWTHEVPITFPSLTKLTLSFTYMLISWNDAINAWDSDLTAIFNMRMLRSLTIRHCGRAAEFLDVLTRMQEPMQLRDFEICLDDSPDVGNDDTRQSVQHFLESFDGLETLTLVVQLAATFGSYLRSFSHHLPSLNRLVWHGRWEESELVDCPLLDTTSNLYDDGYDEFKGDFGEDEVAVILATSSLDFLGLCIKPLEMKKRLKITKGKISFEFLHLRFTGFDEFEYESGRCGTPFPYSRTKDLKKKAAHISGLYDLVDWAFGPDGPAKLKVIACGDFSYKNRYSIGSYLDRNENKNILFCRNTQTVPSANSRFADLRYHIFEESDTRMWEKHVGHFEESLRAGAVNPLVRPYRHHPD